MTRELAPHQRRALDFVRSLKRSAVFLDPGMGKTAVALHWMMERIVEGKSARPCVLAPLLVARTVWDAEAREWRELRWMRFHICVGTKAQKTRAIASWLEDPGSVLVANWDSIPLFDELWKDGWPVDLIILDEADHAKGHSSKRFESLAAQRIKRLLELTATPASNGFMGLWALVFLIDGGRRLGRNITAYRDRHFNSRVVMGKYRQWWTNASQRRGIERRIKDVCLSIPAKGRLPGWPRRVDLATPLAMPPALRKRYRLLEREAVLELESGAEEAFDEGVPVKLLQFCNGQVYMPDGSWEAVHDLKIKAMRDILDRHPQEAFLVAYSFKSDAERLQKEFPSARILKAGGGRRAASDIADWNAGRVRLLMAHPRSCGHGLNLQEGGRYCLFYSLCWDLSLYIQFTGRLLRRGQRRTVIVNRLYMEGTVEEVVAKAIKAKRSVQRDLLKALARSAPGAGASSQRP